MRLGQYEWTQKKFQPDVFKTVVGVAYGMTNRNKENRQLLNRYHCIRDGKWTGVKSKSTQLLIIIAQSHC